MSLEEVYNCFFCVCLSTTAEMLCARICSPNGLELGLDRALIPELRRCNSKFIWSNAAGSHEHLHCWQTNFCKKIVSCQITNSFHIDNIIWPFDNLKRIYSVSGLQCFYTPNTIYVLLCSTLLCKTSTAPRGVNVICPLNRIDPIFSFFRTRKVFMLSIANVKTFLRMLNHTAIY